MTSDSSILFLNKSGTLRLADLRVLLAFLYQVYIAEQHVHLWSNVLILCKRQGRSKFQGSKRDNVRRRDRDDMENVLRRAKQQQNKNMLSKNAMMIFLCFANHITLFSNCQLPLAVVLFDIQLSGLFCTFYDVVKRTQ